MPLRRAHMRIARVYVAWSDFQEAVLSNEVRWVWYESSALLCTHAVVQMPFYDPCISPKASERS